VWKTEGELEGELANISITEDLEEILKKIDTNDKGTIRRLDAHVKVTNLQLSDDQILLVRLPGMSTTAPVSYCVI
jgi:hypothetical protein